MDNTEFKLYLIRINMTTKQLADMLDIEVGTLYKYSSLNDFPNRILIIMKLIEENHDLKQLNNMLMKGTGAEFPKVNNKKHS